ncbi:non-specific lipid transfer protein GPI-anchored 1-like [Zingiber officinale]|uniref:non-specific lipid transfer protein GPI-anchored 1-like n=1 Tax=Zingiber officinale TaxID=94328 RepID=UPI001C4D69D3|nr:non-specific lipid transfer protein GPI-anchored 1-like [Zingiber officinale]
MAGADTAFLLAFLASSAAFAASQDSSMQQKCGQEFTKVTSCLNYATAKADAPTAACCSAVTDIRNTDAACLCFIIQQTHSGSPAVKSLGLQFDRLLQLPDACHLVNSSVSNCPKLLKLSPNSPDYAIFTNSTKVASTSISNETATVSNSNTPNGVRRQVDCVGVAVIGLVSTIVFSIFSVGA